MTAAAAAEVYFYDAVENVEDLASMCNDNDDDSRQQSLDPRLSKFQSRLANICRCKANVRNRKVSLSSYLSLYLSLDWSFVVQSLTLLN